MKNIKKEYAKLIQLTQYNDDWKTLDISRINLDKFLEHNNEIPEKTLDLEFKNIANELNINNNCIEKNPFSKYVELFYDSHKALSKVKNHRCINKKIYNLNYMLSPYFINISVKNDTKTKKTIFINNIINPGIGNFHHQKNLIKVGKNCDISIVEKFIYLGKQNYVSNIYSDIYIGKNSVVDYYCIKESYQNSIQIFHQNSYLEKNAKLKYFIFSFGKGIQYTKKSSNLINIKSKVDINSISYTNKREKKSINFNVNHFIKDCQSNINTKGIFNSIKESSVIGKINIKKNCSNSQAFFHSDNLITMKNTKVNIRPILKIYNKDVVCSHGTTIGFLGKEEIFYLQSRGIDVKESEQMLKHCFIKPSINLIKLRDIKNVVKNILGLTGIYI